MMLRLHTFLCCGTLVTIWCSLIYYLLYYRVSAYYVAYAGVLTPNFVFTSNKQPSNLSRPAENNATFVNEGQYKLVTPGYKTLRFNISSGKVQQPLDPPTPAQNTENSTAQSNKTTDIKVIYAANKNTKDYDSFNFSSCEYSNCVGKSFQPNVPLSEVDFDVGIFRYSVLRTMSMKLYVPWQKRQNQLWLLGFTESWGFGFNRWPKSVNGIFNGTSTFRRDSEVHWLHGKSVKKSKGNNSPAAATPINYAANKTKGAFAYVSHCNSVGYDRLGLMNQLAKYVDVDIFGGCTRIYPCKSRYDAQCYKDRHSHYRFFLSFENTLCMDYITEKFWVRLRSPDYHIPIAVGGANITDYTRAAPPDSFIHINNFTNVKALGQYLQHLMNDDEAYNRYHAWRDNYDVLSDYYEYMPCQFCEIANKMPRIPARKDLSDWWNNGPRGTIPRV